MASWKKKYKQDLACAGPLEPLDQMACPPVQSLPTRTGGHPERMTVLTLTSSDNVSDAVQHL